MKGFKTLLLRNLPVPIHAYLLCEQARFQLEKGQKISLERVIYKIIREKMEEKNEK
ncbi:MAG: hypothetical protein LBS43_12550 [Prevotellaceae bacterium]|jgi:hypothetical protein|nr:hypothetical protein [Prevotellaceae bacterium]